MPESHKGLNTYTSGRFPGRLDISWNLLDPHFGISLVNCMGNYTQQLSSSHVPEIDQNLVRARTIPEAVSHYMANMCAYPRHRLGRPECEKAASQRSHLQN